jgi:2-C-methyl-D-erythritol 4-phosphate cytidylyltransferase
MTNKICNSRIYAIILAAGSGSRMGASLTKQRMLIMGKSVVRRAAEAFDRCTDIDGIVVVARDDEREIIEAELNGNVKKLYSVVKGGKTRAESAREGFLAIPSDADIVAIHDAARCLILPEDISKIIAKTKVCGAATATAAVVDTIKEVDESGRIISTVDRRCLRRTQTPQVFATELYKRAIETMGENIADTVTDDCMLLEKIGVDVYTVDVGAYNIKITTVEDISVAETILKARG